MCDVGWWEGYGFSQLPGLIITLPGLGMWGCIVLVVKGRGDEEKVVWMSLQAFLGCLRY